ncbi:MAG TPA: hypothetical protein P5200_01600 [Tenuifilaceae bacterium]|nr:hypothetical protein [Tenuifilaceae bacterium]
MSLRIKLFAFLAFVCLSALAQRDIEPSLVFSDTVNYHFSGEWQYLSTDIYLFNGEKFSTLINELDFVRQGQENRGGLFRRKSSLSEEYLEYLFITARLKNVKFFGDNDVTYPLYNFQISKDKDEKYRTFVSDNIDYVRLIDNLPLYSASDFIDAEIKVRAITNNDRDQILGLVASQLQSLSKIQTPTNALLGIIGEFGNFIEANTKKKEYRFSSTIRLFEQKNFDTRLHSIRVYALLTSNSQPVRIETGPLESLLDTVDNPEVNRQLLATLLNYQSYPLIVVANYKSLYKMEQVSGDEVNFANIEKRKIKIETDFKAGLINVETYRQEKDFIGFITVFAHLKNHLEVYSLNFRTGNTEAISGELFKLTQYYRQLNKTYSEIKEKYKGNSTFQSVFRKEYESIMAYASQYLNEDHNLKGVKSLVSTMLNLENQILPKTNPELEETITALRFADVFKPHHTSKTIEGELIKINTEKLEQRLYRESYEDAVNKLNNVVPSYTNKSASDELRNLLRNTACQLCRQKGFEAISAYNLRYEEFEKRNALNKRDSLVTQLQPWIFERLQQIQLIRENIATAFSESKPSETQVYLTEKLQEAERDVKNLQELTRIDASQRELSIVENLNSKLTSTKNQAQTTFVLICSLKPDVCQKPEPPKEIEKDQKRENLSKTFSAENELVRQTDVFIAIFEFQVKSIASNEPNEEQGRKLDSANSLIKQLNVANKLYSENLEDKVKLKSVEIEINSLVREISDLLSELEKSDKN